MKRRLYRGMISIFVLLFVWSSVSAQSFDIVQAAQTVDEYYNRFVDTISSRTRFIWFQWRKERMERRLWTGIERSLQESIQRVQEDQKIIFEALWARVILRDDDTVTAYGLIQNQELINAINTYRTNQWLPVVGLDPLLMKVAYRHANDLHLNFPYDADGDGVREVLSHRGSDGTRVMQRAQQAWYDYALIAENLAYNQLTSQQVLSDWILSPTHHENLLLLRATDIGIAKVWSYWVMVVGAPRR